RGRRDRVQRAPRRPRGVGDQEQPDLDAAPDAPARLRLSRAAQAGHVRRGAQVRHRARRALRHRSRRQGHRARVAERDALARARLQPAAPGSVRRPAALHVPLPQPGARGRDDDAQYHRSLASPDEEKTMKKVLKTLLLVLALAPGTSAAGLALVGNENAGTITLIDTALDEVVGEI